MDEIVDCLFFFPQTRRIFFRNVFSISIHLKFNQSTPAIKRNANISHQNNVYLRYKSM